MTHLDCASFSKDNCHAVHIDNHGSDIGHSLVTSSVLVLRVHTEVRQVGGDIADFGKGVGAGSHVVMSHLIKSVVVRIATHWADASAWTGRTTNPSHRLQISNKSQSSQHYQLSINMKPLWIPVE